ncbi:MAG: SRPBCC domain-containing protein [Ferruginibacter sp.]
MEYNLSLEFFVYASPDEVMELLTNPEFIREWSGEESLIEKKVGGQFVMFDGWVEGKILAIDNDELAYTWKPNTWPETVAASEVHYKLVAAPHGTEVFITHTGFPNKEEMESHRKGWDEQFFAPIGEYLANRNH